MPPKLVMGWLGRSYQHLELAEWMRLRKARFLNPPHPRIHLRTNEISVERGLISKSGTKIYTIHFRKGGRDALLGYLGGTTPGHTLIAHPQKDLGRRDDGLFRAAAAQSGFGGALHRYPGGLNNTAIPRATYNRLVSATACAPTLGTPASLECLRSLPFTDLMAVLRNTSLNVMIWLPAMDGDFIADYPSRRVREGKLPRVPILVGQNTDEGACFGQNRSASGKGINTDEELEESVTRIILGPNPDPPTLYRRTAALYGDWMQSYQRRRGLIKWSKHGVPAYSYRFDVTTVGIPGYMSAAHFQEVAFVFYNLDGVGYARNPFEDASKSYKALAKTMSNTWWPV
ncbi:hypothetical protein DL771_010838 [Monosporascus sp. 5C6A]|nr:hypothetical protein DL771_010838 [Monosporascus sp. 5C6A]